MDAGRCRSTVVEGRQSCCRRRSTAGSGCRRRSTADSRADDGRCRSSVIEGRRTPVVNARVRRCPLVDADRRRGVRLSTSLDGSLRGGRRSVPVHGGRRQAVRWSTPIKGAVRLSTPESFNTIGRQWQMTRPCNHANVLKSPAGGTDGEIRLAWSVWQVDYAGKLSLIAKTGDCAFNRNARRSQTAAARQGRRGILIKGRDRIVSRAESSKGPKCLTID
jgi:hypothetical protein